MFQLSYFKQLIDFIELTTEWKAESFLIPRCDFGADLWMYRAEFIAFSGVFSTSPVCKQPVIHIPS